MHAPVRDNTKTEAIPIIAPLEIECLLSGALEGGSHRRYLLLLGMAFHQANENNSQDLALRSQVLLIVFAGALLELHV